MMYDVYDKCRGHIIYCDCSLLLFMYTFTSFAEYTNLKCGEIQNFHRPLVGDDAS